MNYSIYKTMNFYDTFVCYLTILTIYFQTIASVIEFSHIFPRIVS